MGAKWWGSHALPEGQEGRWRIGTLTLVVQHRPLEWRIASKVAKDWEDVVFEQVVPKPVEDLEEGLSVTRFGLKQRHEEVWLQPAMPDRSVVVRPETRLSVPPGEEVTVHVGVPVWVRVEVGQPPRTLQELPTYRLSDTWFGPSTVIGEFCYALRTSGRLEASAVPFRPHRAVSAVHIENRSQETLDLQRINLPVAGLRIYRRPDGHLCTDDLEMELQNKDTVSVKIQTRSEAEVGRLEVVAHERSAGKKSFLRAMSSLFSG